VIGNADCQEAGERAFDGGVVIAFQWRQGAGRQQ
jgi:hypothetical protein